MTKVSSIIDLVIASYRPVVEAMMEREGMNGETTVDQFRDHFTPDKIKSSEEKIAVIALGGALSKFGANKFAPKLSFTRQCEIVALYRMGYNADVLAKVYGVDRKTVTHMYNPLSNKYRGVKTEEKVRGTEGLIRAYVNEEVEAAIKKHTSQVQGDNNKIANKMQGVHIVEGVKCTFKHRVEIKWCELPEGTGWFYKDMDGDFPEAWLRGDDDSMKNSQACYNHMLKEIEDPL